MTNNQLKIAFDYDDTFTADIAVMSTVIDALKFGGHDVKFVTYRHEKSNNEDIEIYAKRLDIEIIYTNGRQKQHCYDADIWIDDSPDMVVSYEDMKSMITACEKCGDIE